MNLNELTPVQQVRMQNWIKIIRECQSSGLTNKEWCEQNGVSEKSYYYHLAKIRKLALAEIPHKAQIKGFEASFNEETSSFAEVTIIEDKPLIQSSVVIRKGTSSVEINQEIDASLLKVILEAL